MGIVLPNMRASYREQHGTMGAVMGMRWQAVQGRGRVCVPGGLSEEFLRGGLLEILDNQ